MQLGKKSSKIQEREYKIKKKNCSCNEGQYSTIMEFPNIFMLQLFFGKFWTKHVALKITISSASSCVLCKKVPDSHSCDTITQDFQEQNGVQNSPGGVTASSMVPPCDRSGCTAAPGEGCVTGQMHSSQGWGTSLALPAKPLTWLTGEWEWSRTTEKQQYFVKWGSGLLTLTGFTLLWELILQEKCIYNGVG